MNYFGIIFDLDGTILNSTQLNIEAFHHTCDIHLGKRINEADLLKMYGKPLIEQMQYFSPEKANAMIKTYREYSHKYHDAKIALFSDVETILKKLKSLQLKIGLVTSKTKEATQRNLDFFDIKKYFDYLLCFEDVEKHKPNPDPYIKMLDLMNINHHKVISIGDSPFDILGSKLAGLDTILVGWTTFSKSQFEECQPDYIINNFNELFTILQK